MSAFLPWTAPHFKGPRVTQKQERRRKARSRSADERANKAKVRARDRYCRMPLCECYRHKLALHVSHKYHKGMGGNPAGDRSHPDLMILLCILRHRENRISIDNGTLRWHKIGRDEQGHPLVAWEVDLRALKYPKARQMVYRQEWIEVARETALHAFEPFTAEQETILRQLATMEL